MMPTTLYQSKNVNPFSKTPFPINHRISWGDPRSAAIRQHTSPENLQKIASKLHFSKLLQIRKLLFKIATMDQDCFRFYGFNCLLGILGPICVNCPLNGPYLHCEKLLSRVAPTSYLLRKNNNIIKKVVATGDRKKVAQSDCTHSGKKEVEKPECYLPDWVEIVYMILYVPRLIPERNALKLSW